MAYVTSFERSGIKKGLRKGLLLGIAGILTAKFGDSGRRLLVKMRALDTGKLEKFLRFLNNAETIDEVREYLG